jgi:hypothetical protein
MPGKVERDIDFKAGQTIDEEGCCYELTSAVEGGDFITISFPHNFHPYQPCPFGFHRSTGKVT